MITDSKTLLDTITNEVLISFTLSASAKITIGLFDADRRLITVIASHRRYPKGTTLYRWNKKDWEGNAVPDGDDYQIGFLHNNIEEKFLGFIGRTGTVKNAEPIQDAVIASGYLYLATGYGEKNITQKKVAFANPQEQINAMPDGLIQGANVIRCCTDGQYVHWLTWGNPDTNSTKLFIHATKADPTNAFYNFSNGQTITVTDSSFGTYSCWNIVDVPRVNNVGQFPDADIATTSSFNFYLDAGTGKLTVSDKTGTVLQSGITMSGSPGRLVGSRTNGNVVWLLYADKAKKFSVASNGAITDSGFQITGLTSALDVDIAPDDSYLMITDGGASQQVKKYNTTSGALLRTDGTAGGYATNGKVLPNKFLLEGNAGIAIAADGSYWVIEHRNARIKKHTAAGVYATEISYIEGRREIAMQRDSGTYLKSVFAGCREYLVDFSKPFGFESGGWKLVYNWGLALPDTHGFIDVSLMPNDSRLGVVYNELNPASNKLYLLDSDRGLIDTTIEFHYDYFQLYPDGIREFDIKGNNPTPGSPRQYLRNSIIYTNGVPSSLGSKIVIADTVFNGQDPIYTASAKAKSLGEEIVWNGRKLLVMWEGTNGQFPWQTQKWGGGLWDIEAGKYACKFAPKTGRWYNADYLDDYFMMSGNQSNNGMGGKAKVAGPLVITAETHEFYKRQTQASKYHYYSGSGLCGGSFGATGEEVQQGLQSVYEVAGNSWSQHVAELPNKDIVIINNDEGVQNGIYTRLLTGLASMQEVFIPFSLNADAVSTTANQLRLMDSFPLLSFDNLVSNNQYPGWSISHPCYQIYPKPESGVLTDYIAYPNERIVPVGNKWWIVETGRSSYQQHNITARFRSDVPRTETVTCAVNHVAQEWSMDFTIAFKDYPSRDGQEHYVQLLDGTGKVIWRLEHSFINNRNLYLTGVLLNDKSVYLPKRPLAAFQPKGIRVASNIRCSIKCDGKQLQIVYGSTPPITVAPYDKTANLHELGAVQMVFNQTGGLTSSLEMAVGDLSFTFEPQNMSNQFSDADRYIDQNL